MPFLTDRLHDTARQQKLGAALADENARMTEAESVRKPETGLISRFTFDLGLLEAELRAAIIGQDESIKELLGAGHREFPVGHLLCQAPLLKLVACRRDIFAHCTGRQPAMLQL